MKLLLRALVLVPLAGLVACGSGSRAAGSASGAGAAAGVPPLSLLEAIRPAAEVAHQGVRRVEILDEDGAGVLSYRERVATDGDGRFSLRPLEALTPVPADWSLRQITREGFLFRYRDFAIRDEEGFLRNYVERESEAAAHAEAPEEIAGRAVRSVALVARRDGRGSSYTLWLDRETGLPLRVEERGPAGRLRSRLEYESLETDYDASGEVWFRGAHGERALDLGGSLEDAAGRPVPVPRLLPEGFRLHAASILADEGGPWVKLSYTDGVETLFFLHRAPTAASEELPRVVEEEAEGDLYLYRMGAAGVAQADLPEGTFLAVGKVDDALLVDAIESALP